MWAEALSILPGVEHHLYGIDPIHRSATREIDVLSFAISPRL